MTTYIRDWNVSEMAAKLNEEINVCGTLFKARYGKWETIEYISLTTNTDTITTLDLKVLAKQMRIGKYKFNGLMRESDGFVLTYIKKSH